VISRMLRKILPLTGVVLTLASTGAHAQLGPSSLNPGMPGVSAPAAGGGLNPGVTAPGFPTQAPLLTNPRITNYGAGGMQRVPGSPPRFD
jgi:hypothetical protein